MHSLKWLADKCAHSIGRFGQICGGGCETNVNVLCMCGKQFTPALAFRISLCFPSVNEVLVRVCSDSHGTRWITRQGFIIFLQTPRGMKRVRRLNLLPLGNSCPEFVWLYCKICCRYFVVRWKILTFTKIKIKDTLACAEKFWHKRR